MGKALGHLPVATTAFGSLNLRDQPANLKAYQALNSHDVVHRAGGAIAQREGYEAFSAPLVQTPAGLGVIYTSTGTRRLLVSGATRADALNADGSLAGHSDATLTAPLLSFARYAEPNVETVYAASGPDELRKYDATAGFTTPTFTKVDAVTGVATGGLTGPRAAIVAAWPGEDRLVFAGFTAGVANAGPAGLASSPDTVYFSEPGDPERVRTTGFVRLTPGDGELIQAVVPWRELLFIFKETKFFVFSGISIDAQGTAEFVRRVVDTGVGAAGRRCAVGARDGVYVQHRTGLFRTRGDDPAPVFGELGPLWTHDSCPYYSSGLIIPAAVGDGVMAAVEDRIYLSFASDKGAGAQNRLLVLNTDEQWATVWHIGTRGLACFRGGDRDELVFGAPSTMAVNRVRRELTDDDGDPINGYYLTAYEEQAQGRVVRVPRFALWGSGSVFASQARDFEAPAWWARVDFGASGDLWGDGTDPNDLWGDGSDPTDLWGPTAVIQGELVARAEMGAKLAYAIKSVDGIPWLVTGAARHLAGVRPATPIRKDG